MSDDGSNTDESNTSDEETALTRTSDAALQRLDTNLQATERVLARSEDRGKR